MKGIIGGLAALLAFYASSVFGQMPLTSSMPMGMGFALSGVELSAAEYMILDNAVKFIVDPTASPSATMLMLASQLGSVPTSAANMMSFLIPMQALARQRKISVPGVVGTATDAQINDYIMQRTLQWMQQRAMMGQMTENPDLVMRMQQGTSRANPISRVPAQTTATTTNTDQGSAASNFFPMLALGGSELIF